MRTYSSTVAATSRWSVRITRCIASVSRPASAGEGSVTTGVPAAIALWPVVNRLCTRSKAVTEGLLPLYV